MAKIWTFLDFVNDNGVNLVREWTQRMPPIAKQRFTTRIELLEVTPVLQTAGYTTVLEGECDGLFEIKFTANRIQWRPLAYYGPGRRQVTILAGATEKGGRLMPRNACAMALARRDLVQSDRRYVCDHDFS